MPDSSNMTHDPTDVLRRVPLGHEDLIIRLTASDDRGLLAELFESMSFDDRYLRFFSAFRPDDRFLERMATANDHGAHQLLAVIADEAGQSHGVGEAGAWPLANGNGELGMTIAPDHRGWLGPYLLDALLEVAAAAGMPNLEADVLLTNRRMLALLRARGLAVISHDGYSSIRVVISTSGTAPAWAPKDGRPRVLIETPGGRWKAEDAVQKLPLQVITCPGPSGRTHARPCPALAGKPCPLAAGADAIVVHLPDEDVREPLLAAHRSLHAGIPLCVHVDDSDAHVIEVIDRISRHDQDHTGASLVGYETPRTCSEVQVQSPPG